MSPVRCSNRRSFRPFDILLKVHHLFGRTAVDNYIKSSVSAVGWKSTSVAHASATWTVTMRTSARSSRENNSGPVDRNSVEKGGSGSWDALLIEYFCSDAVQLLTIRNRYWNKSAYKVVSARDFVCLAVGFFLI